MSGLIFSPVAQNVTVSTVVGSTVAMAIPGAGSGASVLAYNSGASVAFIKFGDSGIAAATALDTPLPPNSVLPFSIDGMRVTHCTVFSPVGGTTVYVQRGAGM